MSDEDEAKPETGEQNEEAEESLPWLENVEEENERPPLWGLPKEMLALGVGAALVLAASGALIWLNEGERDRVGNVLGMPAELPAELERQAATATPAKPAASPPRTGDRRDVVREKSAASRAARKADRRAPRAAAPSIGEIVQAGAYSTRSRADRAARSLLRKHFRGFEQDVVRASVGSKSVYRVRLQGKGAADRCRALRRSGGDCFVVPH